MQLNLLSLSGIYIHIPFCKKACHYCDFHFTTNMTHIKRMTDSICKEINIRKKEFSGNYNSLYFGGGTPSVLAISEMKQIIDQISKYTNPSQLSEVTVEINPEDVTETLLRGYRELGVNRLSIGVQSLNDHILNWMNRSHNKEKALQSVLLAKKMGFENVSVDFIYGIPGYPNRDIKKELSNLLSTKPFHISCYHFTIEDKTYFGQLKKQKKLREISDTRSEEEFKIIAQLLDSNQYIHYEISNFSLQGKSSQHNKNYWKKNNYLGFGPSAHSYQFPYRSWNVSSNAQYIQQVSSNTFHPQKEELSEIDHFNELIMLGLRTSEGVKLSEALKFLNEKNRNDFNAKIDRFLHEGLIKIKNKNLVMNKEKWLLSEFISRELFILK
ncbi:MAG: radical SAM family heme chaperone HemW [Bacteroidota bacterium]|nr:radical SAM family heme chaperone HemW [Bacteroidota bacterium]